MVPTELMEQLTLDTSLIVDPFIMQKRRKLFLKSRRKIRVWERK